MISYRLYAFHHTIANAGKLRRQTSIKPRASFQSKHRRVYGAQILRAHAAADPVVSCGVKDRGAVTWTRMSIYLFGLPVA